MGRGGDARPVCLLVLTILATGLITLKFNAISFHSGLKCKCKNFTVAAIIVSGKQPIWRHNFVKRHKWAGGKMRMCGYADLATGKMRRQLGINIHILPAHAPSVTGIPKPLTFHGVIC